MSGSKITRVKKDKGFVQIDKFPLQDSRLSWKAKGLLAYMLSMPDDWQFYVTELHTHARDGKDSTRAAMKELQQFGYLVIEKNNREDGKFCINNYLLYERPFTATGKPLRENRSGKTATGKPLRENRSGKTATTNTNITNTNITNNNNTNNKREREKEKSALIENVDSLKYSEKEREKEKNCAKKEKLGIPPPDYPDSFSKDLIVAIEAYFEYRKHIGSPFSSLHAKQAKVLQTYTDVTAHGEAKVISSFYEAISQGWKNNYVRKDKIKNNGKQKKASRKAGKENLSISEFFELLDEGSSEGGF